MARRDRASAVEARRGRRGRSTGGTVRRVLGVLALVPIANRAPAYARLLWALVLDDRTPAARKAVLGVGLGYVVLGRDLIPDDLPIIGGLDDIVVVALALDVFIDGVEAAVLEEHLEALGIDRAAFDDDVARLRRVLPGPLRRTIRRLPGLAHGVAAALQQTDLGPRLRAWITREESIA